MTLTSINKVLRVFRLVMVVGMDIDGDADTRLWIETTRGYDERTKKQSA